MCLQAINVVWGRLPRRCSSLPGGRRLSSLWWWPRRRSTHHRADCHCKYAYAHIYIYTHTHIHERAHTYMNVCARTTACTPPTMTEERTYAHTFPRPFSVSIAATPCIATLCKYLIHVECHNHCHCADANSKIELLTSALVLSIGSTDNCARCFNIHTCRLQRCTRFHGCQTQTQSRFSVWGKTLKNLWLGTWCSSISRWRWSGTFLVSENTSK